MPNPSNSQTLPASHPVDLNAVASGGGYFSGVARMIIEQRERIAKATALQAAFFESEGITVEKARALSSAEFRALQLRYEAFKRSNS